MSKQSVYDSNRGIIGETFSSWHGMGATYIHERNVSQGFRMLCESTPHHAWDHIMYGKRSDGQYIGVGQPYPLGADAIREINDYCQAVGLDMLITGGSTWHTDCMRILFQRDDTNVERFNIAINCARWRDDDVSQGATHQIIAGVNSRLKGTGRGDLHNIESTSPSLIERGIVKWDQLSGLYQLTELGVQVAEDPEGRIPVVWLAPEEPET